MSCVIFSEVSSFSEVVCAQLHIRTLCVAGTISQHCPEYTAVLKVSFLKEVQLQYFVVECACPTLAECGTLTPVSPTSHIMFLSA